MVCGGAAFLVLLYPSFEAHQAGCAPTSKPGYQTGQERIGIAGVGDFIICSRADRQQFFDPIGEADRMGISPAA